MHPSEIETLFQKANRFLNKDSYIKEKLKIKNEIYEKAILDGVQKDQNKE